MATTEEPGTVLEETTVVDVDFHTTDHRHPEVREAFVRHIDEPYRSRVEHESLYGSMYMAGTWSSQLGGKSAVGTGDAVDADDVRELADEFSVDHPILNSLAAYNSVQETDKAMAMMRAGNDLLLDRWLDGNDDWYGLATLAAQRPDAAADEIDRLAGEDQIVGVMFYNNGAPKPLGDPRYDPVYRAAEDHGLPVVYHSAASLAFSREAPVLTWGVESYLENHALSHPWAHMLTFTSLIGRGVPAKFPDLDFVFLEAGLGWIPYMTARLNREWGQRRADAPLLEKEPEKYVRDQFYFGTQPIEEPLNEEHLRYQIEMVGPESLLFCTDSPHFDFDNPETIDGLMRRYFTEEERERVLRENAAAVFDLDV